MEPLVLGLRVLLALACVIGLIWVLARRAGWGKGRRRPAGPAVEVIGRHAFGRHAGVAVVAVGDRRLLLGYGEQNVTMLTELDPADPAEEDALAAEEAAASSAPLTLGSLAAAVLPRQRASRTVPSPVPPAPTESFEAVLAASTATPAGASTGIATGASTGAATAVATATATAAASASAAAALAAAAAIPVVPARRAPVAADRAAASAAQPVPAAASPSSSSDVPGLAGLELADVDPDHLPGLERAAGEPVDVRHGALHGSVLAPSTWKQAVAALRERTVRR
jgi:flagellar protein FliO/FliZ